MPGGEMGNIPSDPGGLRQIWRWIRISADLSLVLATNSRVKYREDFSFEPKFP
jgi:hypothetical protein